MRDARARVVRILHASTLGCASCGRTADARMIRIGGLCAAHCAVVLRCSCCERTRKSRSVSLVSATEAKDTRSCSPEREGRVRAGSACGAVCMGSRSSRARRDDSHGSKAVHTSPHEFVPSAAGAARRRIARVGRVGRVPAARVRRPPNSGFRPHGSRVKLNSRECSRADRRLCPAPSSERWDVQAAISARNTPRAVHGRAYSCQSHNDSRLKSAPPAGR